MEPSNFEHGENPSLEDFLAESFGNLNVGASISGSPNIFTQTFDNPNIWNAAYQTLYQGKKPKTFSFFLNYCQFSCCNLSLFVVFTLHLFFEIL